MTMFSGMMGCMFSLQLILGSAPRYLQSRARGRPWLEHPTGWLLRSSPGGSMLGLGIAKPRYIYSEDHIAICITLYCIAIYLFRRPYCDMYRIILYRDISIHTQRKHYYQLIVLDRSSYLYKLCLSKCEV